MTKTIRINFQRLHADAVVPTKAHETDAGYDLTAVSKIYDAHGNYVYGTGIAVEIPEGYCGLVFPRSSVADKSLVLSNGVGVIDSGYRGQIMAKFKPTTQFSNDLCTYNVGDRIAQLIVIPTTNLVFCEQKELSKTDRGKGGYGSTGK